MSTMDSQLLATGSLVTRDLIPIGIQRHNKIDDSGENVWSMEGQGGENPVISRESVIVSLAITGLVLSLWSDLSILDLGLLAFSMYAVMFPSVFATAFSDNIDGRSVVCSILAGEAVVFLALFSPESFDGWWIQPVKAAVPTAVVPSLAMAIFALLASQYAFTGNRLTLESRGAGSNEPLYLLGLTGIFVLAQDFWWWDEASGYALGLPIWIWWALGLSISQTIIMAKWSWRRPND